MSLLWPISAIVAGALGGSALLLMYMLRLRRRPVRVSSIMFWGDPPRDLEANVPLRMVRPAWTLLLQAAAVALLALALGRPAIDARGGSSDRLYIVIDTSASMSAKDGGRGRTRLQSAKDEARVLIDGVGGLSGSSAMLITLGARAQGASSMTGDRGALLAALDGVEATDEAGDLNAALDLVASLISSQASEGASAAGARMIVLSDGSFERGASRPVSGATLEFRPVPSGGGNAGGAGGAGGGGGGGAAAPVTIGRDNVGIVAMAARRDDSQPTRIRTFVRLISVRPQDTSLTLTLTINGEELARRASVVPAARPGPDAAGGGATAPEDARTGVPAGGSGTALTPGEQSFALEFDHADGGVLEASIDRADLLSSDNAASVVVPPVQRPRILLVTPDTSEFFLRGVLEELPPAWLRVIDGGVYESAAGGALLDEADLVVFDRVTPGTPPDRPTISFGAGLASPGLEQVAGGPPGGPTGATEWDRTWPPLASAGLDSLQVSGTIRLRQDPDAGVRVLARGRDGPLIVRGRDAMATRVVVTFAPADSNWPLSPGFAIFIASTVDELLYAGAPGQGRSWRAGEAITSRGGDQDRLQVQDAAGREVASGVGAVLVPRAGVYTLRSGGESRALSVNVASEHESRLDVEGALRIAGDQVRATSMGDGPRELWFWFVLAAGLVLMVEWLVYLGVARA